MSGTAAVHHDDWVLTCSGCRAAACMQVCLLAAGGADAVTAAYCRWQLLHAALLPGTAALSGCVHASEHQHAPALLCRWGRRVELV
jgi:hypothetical protein